jgi:Flp pilus assembly protein TadG
LATKQGFRTCTRPQRGATLVEFTITFMVFLIVILGIIEFSLVVYDASRLAEATRAAARFAIVNEPACDIFGKGSSNASGCSSTNAMTCPGAAPVTAIIQTCATTSTSTECKMVRLMDQMMLRSHENSVLSGDGTVNITYRCSDVGDPGLPGFVPLVTVAAENIRHPMMFASIFGFYTPGGSGIGSTITLPKFETTRTGEDMYSN